MAASKFKRLRKTKKLSRPEITKKLEKNLSIEEDARVLEVSRTIGEGDI